MGTHLNCVDKSMQLQMGTHNMCLYKKVDKQYTGFNPKTTELLDCALIGICVVIRSNMACFHGEIKKNISIIRKKICLFWGYAYSGIFIKFFPFIHLKC